MLRSLIILTLTASCLGVTYAQALDISSGGAPTIAGSLGGSVTGSASVLANLVVVVNFGELSPLNTNNIVNVTVPIAIRSNQAYRVTVTYAGASNANPQALQRSDIAFAVRNFRAMGANSRVCSAPHLISAPFNNVPLTGRTTAANGRSAYLSDLADVTGATTILTGPRLSNGNNSRETNDGYIFDAIIAITPQFYTDGITTATLTFTISSGPNAPC